MHHRDEQPPQLHELLARQRLEDVDFLVGCHPAEHFPRMEVLLDALVVEGQGPVREQVFVVQIGEAVVAQNGIRFARGNLANKNIFPTNFTTVCLKLNRALCQ